AGAVRERGCEGVLSGRWQPPQVVQGPQVLQKTQTLAIKGRASCRHISISLRSVPRKRERRSFSPTCPPESRTPSRSLLTSPSYWPEWSRTTSTVAELLPHSL